jgi:hypothetical protein
MRKTLIVLAALLACGVARAANPDPGLTVEQALNISAALRALDTYEAKDKDGKSYAAPYTFSGVTRMAIAVDLEKTSAVLKTYQATLNEVIKTMSGGTGTVPGNKMADYNVEVLKMLAAPAGVSLTRIKQADLKLDENPIPGSVLGLLLPIIDR